MEWPAARIGGTNEQKTRDDDDAKLQGLHQWGYNLDKFPPALSAIGGYGNSLVFTLPAGAIIEAKRRYTSACNASMPVCGTEFVSGSTLIDGDNTVFTSVGGPSLGRQLMALEYIQAKFCPAKN